MEQNVKDFFERFQRAMASLDIAAIGNFYADTFMFGGPNGVQSVNKADFLKVVPGMKAHFASMGLSETRLQSFEAAHLDSRYLLSKTAWKMTVQDAAGGSRSVGAFATYILQRKDADAFSIVFQLDHQDLATAIRRIRGV
jgi:ketosteroid isomerase-like protein